MRGLAAAMLLAVLTACSAAANPEAAPSVVASEDTPAPLTGAYLEARERAGVPGCPAATEGALPVEKGLPPVELECFGADSRLAPADLRGKPILMVFWAQWCAPCRKEMPMLSEALRDKDVTVLLVSTKETQYEYALDLMIKSDMQYPVLVDEEGELAASLGLTGLPLSVFVDADGTVAHIRPGAWESVSEIQLALKQHLGVV